MNPEVIVLGGCVTDFTVYTPRLPVPGETVVAKLFQYGYGGKAANSAYMCVLLGVHTILISKLGDDYFGQNYLKHLEAIGINVRHVTVEKNCSSPIANITVADSGENSIVYFPGCLDRIAETDIKSAESMFKRAKHFACSSDRLLLNICYLTPHDAVELDCNRSLDKLLRDAAVAFSRTFRGCGYCVYQLACLSNN